MEYEYSGEAHRELVDAYARDESPFPTDNSRVYPRRDHLRDEPALLKALLFPRCWNATDLIDDPEAVHAKLSALGTCVYTGGTAYGDLEEGDFERVDALIDALLPVRERLKHDAEAAYKGDPAAKSYCEIIRSYPGFQAVIAHRFAHELYEDGIQKYAREIAEYAKGETGIDIHPGAQLGEYFFIDHGTGVVIGETVTVGEWARIYQNVTLGALHFEEEEGEDHMLKKGTKRHPDLGDHVVIGAGSNVLGAISIGDHVSIGANSWVADDIPDNTSVYIADHPTQERKSTE